MYLRAFFFFKIFKNFIGKVELAKARWLQHTGLGQAEARSFLRVFLLGDGVPNTVNEHSNRTPAPTVALFAMPQDHLSCRKS